MTARTLSPQEWQREVILGRLQLTQVEQNALRQKTAWSEFFPALIHVYEEQTAQYLAGCKYGVKQLLRKEGIAEEVLDSATTERTVRYGYIALSMENPALSFLPSLVQLLENTQNTGLLVSLGMKAFHKTDEKVDHLDHLVVKVFQSYVARFRLFQELRAQWLAPILRRNITKEMQESLFPFDLFDAFQCQEECCRDLMHFSRGVSQEELPKQAPQIMARVIRERSRKEEDGSIAEHRCPLFAALRALIIHVGTVLRGCEIAPEMRREFFGHLASKEKLSEFAKEISRVYLSFSSEAVHTEIMGRHSALYRSNISSVCHPTLRLLGIQVSLSTEDIERAKKGWIEHEKSANEQVEQYRAQLDAETRQCIQQAHEQINQQLANIKFETVIRVGMGFRL